MGEDQNDDGDRSGEPLSDDSDPNSGGDGVTKPFSNPAQEAATKVKLAPVMTPEAVYHGNKSMTGHTASSLSFPLSYGSADLNGFKYFDTVCLNPLNFNDSS